MNDAATYTLAEQPGVRQFSMTVQHEWLFEVSSTRGSRFVEFDALPVFEGNAPGVRLQWINSLETAEKFAELLHRQREIWLNAGEAPDVAQLLPVEPSGFVRFVLAVSPDELPLLAELISRAVVHARSLQLVKGYERSN